MAISKNWEAEVAREVISMRNLTTEAVEKAIKEHCPFQRDTVYVPASLNHHLERAVIEAAITFRNALDWDREADVAPVLEAVDALIAAREKQ